MHRVFNTMKGINAKKESKKSLERTMRQARRKIQNREQEQNEGANTSMLTKNANFTTEDAREKLLRGKIAAIASKFLQKKNKKKESKRHNRMNLPREMETGTRIPWMVESDYVGLSLEKELRDFAVYVSVRSTR